MVGEATRGVISTGVMAVEAPETATAAVVVIEVIGPSSGLSIFIVMFTKVAASTGFLSAAFFSRL
jgi:hypothetical protein